MRNVLILGSGRSGTSMLGGTFAHAGWFVGDAPYGPRDANPKGFFESPEINGVNEDLLAATVPASEGLGAWQRWLARLPRGTTASRTERSDERIARAVLRAPYAYKDPRFAWTLPAWDPFTADALRVCVFRHPLATAASVVKECRDADYLRGVAMSRERALSIWLAQYESLLALADRDGEWLFVHYEQVLSGSGLDRIERAVGAPVARDFPEAALRRSPEDGALVPAVVEVYAELCRRAGHALPRGLGAPSATVVPDPAPRAERADPLAAVRAEREAVRRAVRASATRAGALDAPELEFAHGLTLAAADAFVVERLPRIADLEREVVELAALDPRTVAAAGIGRAASARSARALGELVEVARREGYVAGLADLGLDSFDALRERAPWPLATATARRVLAWPAWTVDELAALLAAAPPLLRGPAGAAALCLRHVPEVDGPLDAALERLSEAAELVATPGAEIEVLVVDDVVTPSDVQRLGRAVDAWIDLPSSTGRERAGFRSALGSGVSVLLLRQPLLQAG